MMMIISKSKLMIIFNVLFQYKVFPLIHLKTVNFLLPVCLDMQYFMGMVNYSFFLDVVDVVTTESYLLHVKI